MNDIIQDAMILIEKRFEGDASGHDYYHSIRVYQLAVRIAAREAADTEIVQLAALLHDVDDRKLFASEKDLECARSFLEGHRVSPAKQERILRIIREVSFKGNASARPTSIEGMIVQDADRLDALGAVGIARTFAYGGSRGRAIHLPLEKPLTDMSSDEYYNNRGTSINHFYEKLLKLKDLMSTEEGKRIAEGRHQYMLQFLDEFYGEWDGTC